jgi:hypothetical protein
LRVTSASSLAGQYVSLSLPELVNHHRNPTTASPQFNQRAHRRATCPAA